jgi:Na+/proline symporter
MVGTSLSGVTFISVPGGVGAKGMTYLQVVLGYLVGYGLIATLLLPLYYRLRLTSIYEYLGARFGPVTYKTGAWLFLVSRTLGSAARLYLTASVLQFILLDALGVPFALTVLLTLGLIMLYTHKGGLRTIVWTDTLQTAFMLLAVALTAHTLATDLDLEGGIWQALWQSPYSQMFVWDSAAAPNYFWKDFLGGALIALVMTGLDQDMMQKNLTIRTLRAARWNIATYSLVLVLVNLLFLALGALLYLYIAKMGITPPERSDMLYPHLALQHFSPMLGILFLLGLIAAAYSSADGSLAALTTSYCIDIRNTQNLTPEAANRLRRRVHWAVAGVFYVCILGFHLLASTSVGGLTVLDLVLAMGTYTYGPLLGLYAFGLATRRPVHDAGTPWVCIAAPLLCLLIAYASPTIFDYKFGIELIAVNGLFTFVGLLLLGRKASGTPTAGGGPVVGGNELQNQA